MLTEKNTLESSTNQCNQMKELKENNKLHKLQEQCKEFKNELETLTAEKGQVLENLKKLKEQLLSIEGKLDKAKAEEVNWKMKLNGVEGIHVDNQSEVLKNICFLLGYDVFKYQVLDNNASQVTLRYRDICYITYCETAGLYDVIEIYPQHPNFLQIQQFLKNSQDLRGLLATLRKFFDIAIQLRENENK